MSGEQMTEGVDPTTEFDATVEGVIDALEPLGFESHIVAWDGSEPCASMLLDDGRCLDVTVTLRRWCNCCAIDGTHHHELCEHPCCREGEEEPDA